ncbi:LPS export ABC transporter periplasmic protein LptC [Candidatus Poribacteria bacterium]|nr:LPS export ABC transporter periplasmic protein LptC [Candidatus Poribacteria bacterium]|tara:strand:- start:39 stop:608 length:570 start_codon:yes stop_codon:yes gene_type:complete
MIGGKHNQKYPSLSLVIMLAFIAIYLGCNAGENQVGENNAEDIPQQQLTSFSTSHTEGGVLKWELVGHSATSHLDVTSVDNPVVKIFQNGRLAITVTGQQGELIQSNQNVKVFEDVIAISQDGKMFTDELHWLNDQEKLYAPNESRIERGDSVMFGNQAMGDPDLRIVQMKQVRAKLYPKDKKNDETNL